MNESLYFNKQLWNLFSECIKRDTSKEEIYVETKLFSCTFDKSKISDNFLSILYLGLQIDNYLDGTDFDNFNRLKDGEDWTKYNLHKYRLIALLKAANIISLSDDKDNPKIKFQSPLEEKKYIKI